MGALYKDKNKSEHWTGFENTKEGGTETIYAEITKPSKRIGDFEIRVEHTYSEGADVIEEFDRIQVTAIWADDAQAFEKHQYHKITHVDAENMTIKVGEGGMVPAGMPGEGDLVMLLDDDNRYIFTSGGKLRLGPDQAAKTNEWALFRVKSIRGTEVKLERAGKEGNLLRAFPAWLNKGDRFNFVAPKYIDDVVMLNTIQNVAMLNGNLRDTPTACWGILIRFQARPTGITRVKLADGNRVSFDITRQMSGKIGGKTILWPKGDKPNDDGGGGDNDTATHGSKVAHDFLFSVDQPGFGPPWGLMGTDTSRSVARLNAKEFVRLDFVPSSITDEDLDWGNTQAGSRCSVKAHWCTAINILSDLDKNIDKGAFYKFKKRVRFDNSMGKREAGKDLPKLKVFTKNKLANFLPDNNVYFGWHWADSVIAEVHKYEFCRDKEEKQHRQPFK